MMNIWLKQHYSRAVFVNSRLPHVWYTQACLLTDTHVIRLAFDITGSNHHLYDIMYIIYHTKK